jgi:hypothetical protein
MCVRREYARAVKEGGNPRHAEAALEKRTERVESFHVHPLVPGGISMTQWGWATGASLTRADPGTKGNEGGEWELVEAPAFKEFESEEKRTCAWRIAKLA